MNTDQLAFETNTEPWWEIIVPGGTLQMRALTPEEASEKARPQLEALGVTPDPSAWAPLR